MFKKSWIYFNLLLLQSLAIYGQNPVAYKISSEEGLPNQTIYSILQDKKGFIWLGTDAGIFKYDGIRYYQYKNSKQKSRSLTGLVQNANGDIYGFNFNGQIFYVKNDSLQYVNSWNNGNISNLCVDYNNDLWVCYSGGIKMLSQKTNKWMQYDGNPKNTKLNNTHSCFIDNDNSFWCLTSNGLMQINNGKTKHYPIGWNKNKLSGEYQLAFNSKNKFVFSIVGGEIFKLINGIVYPFHSKNLNPLLADKKITRIEEHNSNYLWIYTFSGVIVFNINQDKSELFFEDQSFSSGLCDAENTYWLGTLHDGILRIPELSYKLWEIKNNEIINSKIHKLVCNNASVFFATVDGKIGEINYKANSTSIISNKTKQDIQGLALSEDKQCVLYSIQNNIYKTQDHKSFLISQHLPPTKDVLQIGNNYIAATSKGTFWFSADKKLKKEELTSQWTRSIAFNKIKNKLWLATNDGIKTYDFKNNQWNYLTTSLEGVQIISLYFSPLNNKLYALTFNGIIYEFDTISPKAIQLFSLQANVISYQLKANATHLYVATNNGLFVYDFHTKQKNRINRLSGLSSNNIHAIDLDNNSIWLATAKGIQQIPLKINIKQTSSKIYLKRIFINNKNVAYKNQLILNYKDELKIELDAVALSSENKFQYAYRLQRNSEWLFLPSDIKHIEIPFLNTGNFSLEIKLIDHQGKNSINSVLIFGYVKPPFWQRWWFYVLIALTCLALALAIFKQRINAIQKKQTKELERIQLEHDLRLSKETALRAQMNPHFIFNVLNSIKAYIYENDKKKAVRYLQQFSDLVRKILEQSSVSWVKLDEEIEFLRLYIELEAILFSDKFKYNIQINDVMDTSHISIPSLILQPYIENAFKHGLRHKEGEKQLSINFREEDDVLIVTITDNGIGRKKAQLINAENEKKHTSFSTEAIHRISVMNKNQPGVVATVYEDLMDQSGISSGTSVTIKIKQHV